MSKFHNVHWRQHVALDVGTATTRIATGLSSLREKPSRIGTKAGLANGVVVDGETVLQILEPLLKRSKAFGIVKPCVLVCAPSDARWEERQLLAESILKAGAASLSMMPEPLAAAIGSGLDVSSPYAQMVLDIGEGVSDCAVIQSGRIQATCAVRLGCAHMRASIVKAARCGGWTSCDEEDAEVLMRSYGLKGSPSPEGSAVAASALQTVIEKIGDTIDAFFRDIPDSLGCDIIDSGVCLTGGGALIPGFPEYLGRRLGVNIHVAGNPLFSVAEGARAVLPVILSLNQWQ
jgi:rod shape-determining protein MreB